MKILTSHCGPFSVEGSQFVTRTGGTNRLCCCCCFCSSHQLNQRRLLIGARVFEVDQLSNNKGSFPIPPENHKHSRLDSEATRTLLATASGLLGHHSVGLQLRCSADSAVFSFTIHFLHLKSQLHLLNTIPFTISTAVACFFYLSQWTSS